MQRSVDYVTKISINITIPNLCIEFRANSVDPDQPAFKTSLIMIYTVHNTA